MVKPHSAPLPIPARAGHLWLKREDDLLFEICMGTLPDESVLELASRMSRCPVAVALRVLDSEIPEMIGLDAPTGSEEEAEFLGLALSGVPLQACLMWCTASDSRPTASELTEMMSGNPDMRPALEAARIAGLWLSGPFDRQSLLFLAQQDTDQLIKAVAEVFERFDAPTPAVVAGQVLGCFPRSATPFILPLLAPCRSKAKPAKPKARKAGGFASDAARRKYWARRNSAKPR